MFKTQKGSKDIIKIVPQVRRGTLMNEDWRLNEDGHRREEIVE